MKTLRSLWLRLSAVLGVLFLVLNVNAQPTYEGTTFDALQIVSDDATLYFGVIVALAVLVTGFFLGRRWLKRI